MKDSHFWLGLTAIAAIGILFVKTRELNDRIVDLETSFSTYTNQQAQLRAQPQLASTSLVYQADSTGSTGSIPQRTERTLEAVKYAERLNQTQSTR